MNFKFKSSFYLADKDFKNGHWVDLDVEIPQDFTKTVNDIEYKVVIPDYIFNELADTEEQFSTKPDVNNRNVRGCLSERDLARKFKKTQTSRSLEVLKDFIMELSQFILNKHSLETETIKKKLFIKFRHSAKHDRSNLNFAYHGLVVS